MEIKMSVQNDCIIIHLIKDLISKQSVNVPYIAHDISSYTKIEKDTSIRKLVKLLESSINRLFKSIESK